MIPAFRRVAIVNRGEAAVRFLNALREFNDEHGSDIQGIALHTDADRFSLYVRQADDAYNLGPATFVDPKDGARKVSYLDYERLERALVATRADAAWVGWGFVAEHPEFAELCRRLGITFLGPDADAMRQLGDKITSKRIAERAQVPVIPWTGGAVDTIAEAERAAAAMGFPVMVKATAGGGGRGIRRVDEPEKLAGAYESARSQARGAFGDDSVYLEKVVEGARHVEVQILADHFGNVWAVGVRDCSVQRRHQKLVEEAPSPGLPEALDAELRAAAVRLAKVAGYRGAGTVEFLCDAEAGKFYFMEVNTRLQVEHPITELTTGLDLVKMQILIAAGTRLEGDAPRTVGHAIEVRLNAEDADRDFAPAPGRIAMLKLPTGPGIRIDRGVTEGDVVAPEFDSMIAKIMAYGRTRAEALARVRRAVAESIFILEGGTTNKPFLLEVLDTPDFRRGGVSTQWLEQWMSTREHHLRPFAALAWVGAAIEIYEAERAIELREFFISAARARAEVRNEVGRAVELRYLGHGYSGRVVCLGPRQYRVTVGGHRIDVAVDHISRFERFLTVDGVRHRALCVVQGVDHVVEVEGTPHTFSRDDGGFVRAQAPAIVVSVSVAAGDAVTAGQTVAVLEAMKMETAVKAPYAGKVRRVLVVPGTQVGPGAALLQIDQETQGEVDVGGERLDFVSLTHAIADSPEQRCLSVLAELHQLALGYDIDGAEARRLVAEYAAACAACGPTEARLAAENRLLTVFTDISALFRPRQDPDADQVEHARTTEFMHQFLRTLDVRNSKLPRSFLARVERAVAHYGVTEIGRTPEVEEVLHRVFKAWKRPEIVPTLLAVLDQRLGETEPPAGAASPEVRESLDRLIAVAEARNKNVADLGRQVRFKYFDRPLADARRQETYTEVEGQLAALARHPGSPDRDERMGAIVECPQPLERFFGARFGAAGRSVRELMLEALVRRYYRIRTTEGLRTWTIADKSLVTCRYVHEGQRIAVFATHGEGRSLAAPLEALRLAAAEAPVDHELALELYLWDGGPLGDANDNADALRAELDRVRFDRPVRRVAVVLAAPGTNWDSSAVHHFTFRPSAEGFREDRVYRDIHPMMAKRLQLWRLSRFDLERLPSAEDVYLFRATARENKKDERLFAFGEIRDVTAVRDEHGKVVSLPLLERVCNEAFAAIRNFQARREQHKRLWWNRVILNIRPPLLLGNDELYAVGDRLRSAGEGLGLEKVSVLARLPDPATGGLKDCVLSLMNPGGTGVSIRIAEPRNVPVRPLSEYVQKVIRMRARGLVYPYEIVSILTTPPDAETPPGRFTEYDMDAAGNFVPVHREYGQNTANIVAGVIESYPPRYPEGMKRVVLIGDPSREMGSLAEPECKRILAALRLARDLDVPVEWFALSAGARISMENGTENMDWISRVLREIVNFTQEGREINVIVVGINVGAQPYWNAEATMLMHTRGVLIMTAQGAMVLTGKTALDYSGSVSAEDNLGIGGFERIMGPNGQAQYYAPTIHDACRLLLRHYDHCYVFPGERFPRQVATTDPVDRDVTLFPHGGDFATIGEVFSPETNPGRKRPFDIRRVMRAVTDQDQPPLERWQAMHDAEIAVVWDAHLGGRPVCLVGIESKPVPRIGFVPIDGPEAWTSGTLFPLSAKKVARAINAASGNRPIVLLANLSGFDGSPESMRKLQLEYGAEIGRAIVNFKGPILFCVVSRYHGGAFVVFSKCLNDDMEAVALEHTYASVIGGAPAAAVVFAREVEDRARQDARVVAAKAAVAKAPESGRRAAQVGMETLFQAVHVEKLGEVATEFDGVHSVQRALRLGSLDRILPPATLRGWLVEAVERGIAKVTQRG